MTDERKALWGRRFEEIIHDLEVACKEYTQETGESTSVELEYTWFDPYNDGNFRGYPSAHLHVGTHTRMVATNEMDEIKNLFSIDRDDIVRKKEEEKNETAEG